MWRKIEDNAIWSSKEPFCKRAAWIDLLRMVWWKEKEYLLGKNVYHLEPGEIIISIRYLAEHWRWSTKKVQDFLKVLLQLNQITTKIHPGGTQITICHWEEYQQEGHAKETQKLQGGHAEVTKPIKEEGKKGKEKTSPDKRVGRLLSFFSLAFKDTFDINYKPNFAGDSKIIKDQLRYADKSYPDGRGELGLAITMSDWLVKQGELGGFKKTTIPGWLKDFNSINADVNWGTIKWTEVEGQYQDDLKRVKEKRDIQNSRSQKDSSADATVSK